MIDKYQEIMAEVITEGADLKDVIVLAPRGSEGNSQVLELKIGNRQVCVAFSSLENAAIFCVMAAKEGIDMSGFAPFVMKCLPIETGVWLDPSVKSLYRISIISLVNREN